MINIPTEIDNNYLLIPVPPQADGTPQITNEEKNRLLSLIADLYGFTDTIPKLFENETFVGSMEEFQAIEGDKIILSQNNDTIVYNITKQIPNIDKSEFGKNKFGLFAKNMVIAAVLQHTEKSLIAPIKDAANSESENILNSVKENLLLLNSLKLI